MRGIHHIVIETTRLKYEFDIRRNITIIRGDSATGKTTLIDLLQAYGTQGEKSGVRLNADVPCRVYSADASSWKQVLPEYKGSIVFIDENYSFIAGREFADLIQGTDNYYVLITRRELADLPYSINEIYGIRTAGKFHFPQQIYHEFYRIYQSEYEDSIHNAILITEDSNSGFQFFSRAFGKEACVSAGGNADVFRTIMRCDRNRPLVVIADGAAFGAFIEKTLQAAIMHDHTELYLPESFEWLILRAGIFPSKEVAQILEKPENYIDSAQYFSWEQFFTDLLKKTADQSTYTRYQKTKLVPFYLTEANIQKILAVLPEEIKNAMK